MPAVSPERLCSDISRLLHRGCDVREFSTGAARILSRAISFDGFCVLTMDPATLLPTGEVVENGLPPTATARMAAIEISGEDFNSFTALGRSARPVASLRQSTGGDLNRSVRHRELRSSIGLGDELRAVLSAESATWGGLTLLRGYDREGFTPAEAALLCAVSRPLAEGLRRAMLLTALSSDRREDGGAAGMALVAPDNSIAQADAPAERWLAELGEDGALPPVVAGVASRARAIASARDDSGPVALARVQTLSGRWLLVRGSTLGEDGEAQTAVIIEPARSHELAPLIADAYGLTDRERAVTQMVAQGLATNAIAERLHLSPWTVQDHLKSIFEKTGVGTRGELVARVFFEHYAPRLRGGTPVGSDGWFAPS